MTGIYLIFLLLSLVCALAGGNTHGLTAALLEGARQGVNLCISLAGPVSLWCGLSSLLRETGGMKGLSRLVGPLLSKLFPQAWQSMEIREALSGNFSANLLGLGSAATPLGIRAAVAMADGQDTASVELCRLVVLNTASVQLLPATVAALRASLGSTAPLDILPAVWVTSLCSVAAGLLAAWGFSKWLR